MATVFFYLRAGPIGPEKPQRLRRHGFIGRALRANRKPKILPAFGRYMISNLLRFSRPIRSSPMVTKANSIVWMIPNEWPGAWMPLGRVCLIGFCKRGNDQRE